MRAIWKGSINFSLVNIPISLYPATQTDELNFHMLRQKDLSPVSYKRVAQADSKEVPWTEIVKGYEYEKGKYVVLNQEDFQRADVEATQSIDILEFVPLAEVDPIFFDRPYYLEPEKRGARAYALLREALNRTQKVGIAKVVIKTRQHLAAIKPEQKALILELMHFAAELIKPDELQLPERLEAGPRELEMAIDLIDRLSGHWDSNKYTDQYRKALLDLIHQKIESGGRLPRGASRPKKAASNVVDLVSVLQESLRSADKDMAAKGSKSSPKHRKTYKKAA